MRPSYEALPSWLSRLPDVPPTPVRADRPRRDSVLQRAFANPRLPVHVLILAVSLGIGAAVAAGSVREKHVVKSHAEMSAFAERKAAELRTFGTLRARPARGAGSPLAAGGSLTRDVPGYFDVVEGTDGRRFLRRWDIDSTAGGSRRVTVRIMPLSGDVGRAHLDVATTVPRQ